MFGRSYIILLLNFFGGDSVEGGGGVSGFAAVLFDIYVRWGRCVGGRMEYRVFLGESCCNRRFVFWRCTLARVFCLSLDFAPLSTRLTDVCGTVEGRCQGRLGFVLRSWPVITGPQPLWPFLSRA